MAVLELWVRALYELYNAVPTSGIRSQIQFTFPLQRSRKQI
jgi:hypothetical protein